MHGLEQEYQNRLAVVRVDAATPQGAALQDELGVRGHPTIVLVDENGRIQDRFYGVQPVDRLREALQAIFP